MPQPTISTTQPPSDMLTPGERDFSAQAGYDRRMVILSMIVVNIGSAIGTTIAMTRNLKLFDPDQRKRKATCSLLRRSARARP